MKKVCTLAGVVLLAAFALDAKAARIKPVRKGGEVILFDASVHACAVFGRAAPAREAGDNLVANCRPVTKNGRRYAEISYTGERGAAGVRLSLGTMPDPPDGMAFRGIKLEVEYATKAIRGLAFFCRYTDGRTLGAKRTLEPGQQTVVVEKGGRNWGLLKSFAVSTRVGRGEAGFTFLLRKISMLLRPKEPKKPATLRRLTLGPARKAHEILPRAGAIRIDGDLGDPAWRNCAELPDFHYLKGARVPARNAPLQVRITYDKQNLYLALHSEFPTPPIANVKARDGNVYEDEAQELFFSAANDNDQKIQFAMNRAGVIFDYVRAHDLAALKTLTKKERNVKHEKAIRYENGVWTTEIAFPLRELGLDLDETRHMGFQVAQSYRKRPNKRLRTLAWNETDLFPDPRRFGLLVFNSKSFGPGNIEVHRVSRTAREGSTADFYLDCTLRDLRSGDYRAKCTVTVHGRSKTEETRFSVGAERELRKTFRVSSVWNEQGHHTFTLSLANADDELCVLPVNYSNVKDMPDTFGARLLLPEPKHVVWRKGEFAARKNSLLFLPKHASARTRKTAEIFKKKYYGYTGVRLETGGAGPALPQNGIVLRIAGSALFDRKRVKLRKEGYSLSVSPDRILITGYDEPGLYYGMITLFQLIKNSMQIKAQIPIPAVDIIDWPDLGIRSCRLFHPTLNPTWKELRGIEYLIEWTDRFVAGAKQNLLFVDLSRAVQYSRRPEIGGGNRKARYSLEDLKRLARFCRDNFIELCPSWQIGGHSGWLFWAHPELREKGWKGMGNLAHPKHNEIVFDCMLDVIEAMNPKYLSPKMDEYWHRRKKGEEPEKLLYGKTRPQAVLDFHVALNNWLKAKGITMVVYHDMLSPYHNGLRYDVYKVIDRFPKDIVIAFWHGGENIVKEARYFADRGFSLWISGTGEVMPSDEATKRLIRGSGQSLYGFGEALLDKYVTWHSFYAVLRGADYAWNILGDDCASTASQIRSGRLVTVRNIFAVRANPHAGEKITPIDISKHMTHSVGAYLKEVRPDDYTNAENPLALPNGIRDIGSIPTRFSGGQPKNAIVMRQDSRPVALPIGANYASLIFLHTAFVNDPKSERALRGRWKYGAPCGDYVVQYADGRELTLPLRFSENIKRLDTSSLNRATRDNRYILTLKDGNQNNVFVYQWEWVNPRPSVRISKVVARHDRELDVSLILLAVSGRHVHQ